MVQMAGMGIVGLGVLQGEKASGKQLVKVPTGTTLPAGAGAVRSGHLVFLSGIRAPATDGDIRKQTADALAVMGVLLKAAGSSPVSLAWPRC